MTLKLTDTVTVNQANSGGETVEISVADVKELVTADDVDRIDDIETDIGTAEANIDVLLAVMPDLGVPVPKIGETPGTVAVAGKMYIDKAESKLYVCISSSDGTELVLDGNWMTVSLTAIVTP